MAVQYLPKLKTNLLFSCQCCLDYIQIIFNIISPLPLGYLSRIWRVRKFSLNLNIRTTPNHANNCPSFHKLLLASQVLLYSCVCVCVKLQKLHLLVLLKKEIWKVDYSASRIGYRFYKNYIILAIFTAYFNRSIHFKRRKNLYDFFK